MHWYGKQVQNKRKLGHITIVGTDNQEAQQRLRSVDPSAADAMDAASDRYTEATSATSSDISATSESASIPEASTSGRSDADSAAGPAQIGIIMGSDSDLKTMAAAEEVSDF